MPVLEHAVEHAVPRPPVHARVDGVPVAKPLRQALSLVAMPGHMENGTGCLMVRKTDIAPALPRKHRRNALALRLCRFHGLFPGTVPVEN